jgi:hypothetical protein
MIFVGAFVALTLGGNLLYALEKPTGKEIVHPEAGVAITPPNGWTGQAKNDQNSDILFVFNSPSADGTLTISGTQETRRSIRGVWTGLRYSVVIDQGATILQDLPLKFGSMVGRQLVYQTYLSGKAQKTFHSCVGSKKHLFTAVYQGGSFEAQLPAVKGSVMSLRWTNAKPETSPSPSEEETK